LNENEAICATDKGLIYRVRISDFQVLLYSESHVDSVLYVSYPYGISDKFASCS